MAANRPARAVPLVQSELPSAELPEEDEAELRGVSVSGEAVGRELELLTCRGVRFERVRWSGARFLRGRFEDCVVSGSDLSGVLLEDCVLRRVAFSDCRLAGLEAPGCHFEDVTFVDCKLDQANFRLTRWKAAEFRGCGLEGADFYAASLVGAHFHDCSLAGAQLSKADLRSATLHRCGIERIVGADVLRELTIGSELVVPVAEALFGTLRISIDDDCP